MDTPFGDRRSGTDRRGPGKKPAPAAEERMADRRQFPPPDDPDKVSAAARELERAIDAYKKERGLNRLSIDQLLGLMEQMGYRRA